MEDLRDRFHPEITAAHHHRDSLPEETAARPRDSLKEDMARLRTVKDLGRQERTGSPSHNLLEAGRTRTRILSKIHDNNKEEGGLSMVGLGRGFRAAHRYMRRQELVTGRLEAAVFGKMSGGRGSRLVIEDGFEYGKSTCVMYMVFWLYFRGGLRLSVSCLSAPVDLGLGYMTDNCMIF